MKKDLNLINHSIDNSDLILSDKYSIKNVKVINSTPETQHNKYVEKEICYMNISRKEYRKIKNKISKTIDLHGYNLSDAESILLKEINLESNIYILIITGKGYNNEGILKRLIPLFLKNSYLSHNISYFLKANKDLGGEGSFIVKLK